MFLLLALGPALAASPDPDIATFAAALAAPGDFIVPGPVPPPAGGGTGANLLEVSRYGDLVILKDPDGEWLSEATTHALQGDVNWVMSSAAGAFYKHYGDDYDFVNVMMVHDLGMFFAFYSPLANDVKGIGYDSMVGNEVFDQSDNALQGYIFMNYYGLWSENRAQGRFVFGQEFMHRWGAFVNIDADGPPDADGVVSPLDDTALLGRDVAHWSYWFHTTNSPMEGNSWLDNGDGTWTVDLAATSTYSDLDLYLMGFVPPEEVGPQTLLVVDPTEADRVGKEAATAPEAFSDLYDGSGEATTVTADHVDFTLDDIIAAEGPRDPSSADSPKSFRMAFLVILLADDEPDASVLDAVDGVRQNFEADWEEDVRGLADLDTTLGDGDAPDWVDPNAPVDSAGDSDSAASPAPESAGCGCATGHGPGASGLAGLAAGLLAGRRRISPPV